MENIKISEINYGIGFYVKEGDKKWIELNKNLEKYPKLRRQVLAHEMLHYKSKNKHIDFMIDFSDIFNFKRNWGLFKFSLKHPRAFLANSPLFYENRKWSVNWFMCGFTILLVGLIIGGLMMI